MAYAGSVPKLAVPNDPRRSDRSKAKLEQLAADLARLEMESSIQLSQGESSIPLFQRQGYLEKMGHSRPKWFRRFFVLRDTFLLSYNLQKSDFTTEPRSCIHLGGCKVAICSGIERDYCFSIATESGDQFLFSATSDVERQAWIDDLETARSVTHASMVKLAVENQCLAEEKGFASANREESTSSLSIFCNSSYVQETPLTGGMEGWLSTNGFNANQKNPAGLLKKGVLVWKRSYFMLRDSHLLMFNAGDILSKPRGVMYLVGTNVERLPDEGDIVNKFVVRSKSCGDQIELSAASVKSLNRWKLALTVGSRVTYPDYKLLEKERQLLASVVLTPRAPTPRGPGGAMQYRENPPSVLDEEVDLQGNALAPGAVQPYDAEGYPILRNPAGQLVDSQTGQILPPTHPRFSADGEPLDAFNRPLPPNAVAMYDANLRPIGVGPDGQHYTSDGNLVERTEPHFDNQGNQLEMETVTAAAQIAPTIAVAVKVRAILKGEDSVPQSVDPLGRTFMSDTGGDELVTMDGEKVPSSARRIEYNGQIVAYEEVAKQQQAEQEKQKEQEPEKEPEPEIATISVVMETDGDDMELGTVEVQKSTTLRDVRTTISADLGVQDFIFLTNGVPLTKLEEKTKLAIRFEALTIRGRELKNEEPKEKFTRKVEMIVMEQEKKAAEQTEFLQVMNRVKTGSFLKSVGRDLTK
eukprot:c38801_g1_i1.p1 GENE.c38801_g1_i1~~c38801_g1_i1.p1  ORF type:complete len:695 (+),score=145.76 c38801_g1_i1:35-2119(+)